MTCQMRLRALVVVAGLAWMGLAPDVRAAESCTVSTTDFNFGAYDTSSATPLDGSGQVTVECQGNPLTVSLALGPGGGGAFAARRMTSGPEQMTYDLYTDVARTVTWGDGTAGTTSVSCTTGTSGNGCTGTNPQGGTRRAVRPIYGRIPALQNLGVGSYTDVVQVTVTF